MSEPTRLRDARDGLEGELLRSATDDAPSEASRAAIAQRLGIALPSGGGGGGAASPTVAPSAGTGITLGKWIALGVIAAGAAAAIVATGRVDSRRNDIPEPAPESVSAPAPASAPAPPSDTAPAPASAPVSPTTPAPAPASGSPSATAPASAPAPGSPSVSAPASVSTPAPAPAPVSSTTPAPAREGSAHRAHGDAPGARAARSAERNGAAEPAAPTAPERSLAEELAFVDEARALVGPDPSAALARLDAYAERFPAQRFAEEVEVLRIEALRASGRADAARLRAIRFLAAHPRSPLVSRVRDAVPEDVP